MTITQKYVEKFSALSRRGRPRTTSCLTYPSKSYLHLTNCFSNFFKVSNKFNSFLKKDHFLFGCSERFSASSHIYIYIYIKFLYKVVFLYWRLSIGSDNDVCVLHLINELGGGSAAPAERHIVLNSGGCDHCRGCSAVSLSGSSEFLASSLFEVGSSFVNQAALFWSVHGISLQVSRFDVVPLEIDFDRVFIPQFWSTLVSFAGLELPVHQASRHPTFLHSNHVSSLSKSGLDDGGLYAGGLSLIEDLRIGDVVLPPDS